MRNLYRLLIAIVLGVSWIGHAYSVNPDEVLENPALEKRARDLSVQIRCLVCQNQSIDDSDAELARDLRVLVREKLVEGLSDQEILDYLVVRYGEFVLLKPVVNARTYFLWGTPFVLLLIGAGGILLYSRRNNIARVGDPLTLEEKDALSRILDEEK